LHIANVLDYVREGLDNDIWDIETDNITLKNNVRDDIEDIIYSFLDDVSLPEDVLEGVFLYGSMLTKQWNDKTDLDCRIILNRKLMDEYMPGATGDDLFDMARDTLMGIPIGNTKHPLNCTIVIEGEMPDLVDAHYDLIRDELIGKIELEDEDFDPDEQFSTDKQETHRIMDHLDDLFQDTQVDATDAELIKDAIKDVRNPEALQEKLEGKLNELEGTIESLVVEYEEIKEKRTEALTQDAKKDYEHSRHWAPGNVQHKYLERYNYLNVLRHLKEILKGGITEDEVEEVVDTVSRSGAMSPDELRRGMKFEDPYASNASVRDRNNWRWVQPQVEITNIRRAGESPEESLVYYIDSGGNRWKADALWFVNRYGDHVKTADIMTGPPAVVDQNPAAQEGGAMIHGGSCPYCGHVNELFSAKEDDAVTCVNCGRVFQANFSINNPPDEEFLPYSAFVLDAQINPILPQDSIDQITRALQEGGLTQDEIGNVLKLLNVPNQLPQTPENSGIKEIEPMNNTTKQIGVKTGIWDEPAPQHDPDAEPLSMAQADEQLDRDPKEYGLTDEEALELGERIGINWEEVDFDVEQLQMGYDIELEHGSKLGDDTDVTGDDPETTAQIAWAHLKEDPKYYTYLAELEKEFTSGEKESRLVTKAVVRKCKPGDAEDGKPICLYTHDDSKLLGRHPSKESAKKQEQAIKAQGKVASLWEDIASKSIDKTAEELSYTLSADEKTNLLQEVKSIVIGPRDSEEGLDQDIQSGFSAGIGDTATEYVSYIAWQTTKYYIEELSPENPLSASLSMLAQFRAVDQINFWDLGMNRSQILSLIQMVPLQGTYRVTDNEVLFDNTTDAQAIWDYFQMNM